eukprot:TRINITY_DN40692_c0_g1_i1.p1 TRINITY_DN40692_c0_g1~~TRINITY_DN40692_c0_g1_i1.p1  ORF type:complete len:784 (+),score=93.20 TRINITY_DN40692_c0_g1_i1:185-2353(+)
MASSSNAKIGAMLLFPTPSQSPPRRSAAANAASSPTAGDDSCSGSVSKGVGVDCDGEGESSAHRPTPGPKRLGASSSAPEILGPRRWNGSPAIVSYSCLQNGYLSKSNSGLGARNRCTDIAAQSGQAASDGQTGEAESHGDNPQINRTTSKPTRRRERSKSSASFAKTDGGSFGRRGRDSVSSSSTAATTPPREASTGGAFSDATSSTASIQSSSSRERSTSSRHSVVGGMTYVPGYATLNALSSKPARVRANDGLARGSPACAAMTLSRLTSSRFSSSRLLQSHQSTSFAATASPGCGSWTTISSSTPQANPGASPSPPSRLRVAVFNACAQDGPAHPAAISCMAALLDTPWFHSHAVDRLLDGACAAGGKSTVWTPPVEAELLRGEDIRCGRLTGGLPEDLLTESRKESSRVDAQDSEEASGKDKTDSGSDSGHTDPNGNLEPFDVLVVPGGSAATDSILLGPLGLAAVRSFVRQGGSYCGVCAGAYLALTYDDCDDALGLVNATAKMRDGRQRTAIREPTPAMPSAKTSEVAAPTSPTASSSTAGNEKSEQRPSERPPHGDIDVKFTESGRLRLWNEGRPAVEEPLERDGGSVCMRFSNGPLMSVPGDSSAEVLAWAAPNFLPQTNQNHEERGCRSSRCAVMVMEDVAEGRAVLISPHPESTPSSRSTDRCPAEPGKARLRRILQRAVLLAAAGTKNRRWIEEIGHVPAWRKLPGTTSD